MIQRAADPCRHPDLDGGLTASGDGEDGIGAAFRTLLAGDGRGILDLGGRRIGLSTPLVPDGRTGGAPRIVRNGAFVARPGPGWATRTVMAHARYDPAAHPTRLWEVKDIASIEVGAHLEGAGVGREVYVRATDVASGTVTLSQPLWGASGRQGYIFRRFHYLLDLGGIDRVPELTFEGVEFACEGLASGLLLPRGGGGLQLRDCRVTRARDRGVSSHGRGCRDLRIDRCLISSDEQSLPAPLRTSVGLNVNADGVDIRGSRFLGLGCAMVLGGAGHGVADTHLAQGDRTDGGPPSAGIVFTRPDPGARVTGNRFDETGIEITDQHVAHPHVDGGASLGAVTITDNIFTARGAPETFAFLVAKPYGHGRVLRDLTVTGNLLRAVGGRLARMERVETAIAPLMPSGSQRITFAGNTLHNVAQPADNPATLAFHQPDCRQAWLLDPGSRLPFGLRAACVVSVTAASTIRDARGDTVHEMPVAVPVDGGRVELRWSRPVAGRVHVTLRCDAPA